MLTIFCSTQSFHNNRMKSMFRYVRIGQQTLDFVLGNLISFALVLFSMRRNTCHPNNIFFVSVMKQDVENVEPLLPNNAILHTFPFS